MKHKTKTWILQNKSVKNTKENVKHMKQKITFELHEIEIKNKSVSHMKQKKQYIAHETNPKVWNIRQHREA